MADAGTTRELHFVSWLINPNTKENHSDSSDDDTDESGLKECECNAPVNELDSCLLDPEEKYHLPRSSPVISRKRRFNAELETGKLPLTALACDGSEPSTVPLITVKSTDLNPDGLEDLRRVMESYSVTDLKKQEESSSVSNKTLSVHASDKNRASSFPPSVFDHCSSPKSSLELQIITDNCATGGSISPGSQGTQPSSISGRLRGPINRGLWLGPKRRACSDIPSGSGPKCSDLAKKHESCIERNMGHVHTTKELYRSSMDLDQENAHFVVADMVLEVLEAVKWAVCLKQMKNGNSHQHRDRTHNVIKTDLVSSFDSGFEDDSAPTLLSNRHSLASFQSSLQMSRMQCSAEDLAHRLVSEFRKQWFPSEQLYNPDNLNPASQENIFSMMTGEGTNLTEEIRQKSRMRGTLTWAPPRFQIIFCVQPTHRRSDVIASQHFLCAGCGTEVEPRYIKKWRYCDYLGRYFCDGCHGGGESVIPGRVLNNWDFGRYPVCHFSRQLLDSIWQQPLFNLTSVAKNLYNQAKELQRYKDLQEQLISMKKLLSTCRLSDGVLIEFKQLPAHLLEELHIFSMDDLIRVKKGQLCSVAKAILQSATAHIDTCELCQAKGFICEFCHGKDVLFPFQKDICTRCQDCRACFHISCFRDEACPKCARLQKRKRLQEAINL